MTDAEIRLVETMVHRLSEDFDAVSILVSRSNGALGTELLSRGSGNYYARLGMCREFVTNGEAETLAAKLEH